MYSVCSTFYYYFYALFFCHQIDFSMPSSTTYYWILPRSKPFLVCSWQSVEKSLKPQLRMAVQYAELNRDLSLSDTFCVDQRAGKGTSSGRSLACLAPIHCKWPGDSACVGSEHTRKLFVPVINMFDALRMCLNSRQTVQNMVQFSASYSIHWYKFLQWGLNDRDLLLVSLPDAVSLAFLLLVWPPDPDSSWTGASLTGLYDIKEQLSLPDGYPTSFPLTTVLERLSDIDKRVVLLTDRLKNPLIVPCLNDFILKCRRLQVLSQ